MVLAVTVLVGSLGALALHGALIRVRLIADARWRTEGTLIAASALAATRVGRAADIDTLADGGTLILPTVTRSDGWSWTARATRVGSVIRLAVDVIRPAADGTPFAARHASLLLARSPADTVRVLARGARF